MGQALETMGKGPESFSLGSIASRTNFTKEELVELHKTFHTAARQSPEDGTAVINKEQFAAVLASSNVQSNNKQFLELLFNAFDKNGDGVVNFVEYCAGLSIMLKGEPGAKFKLSFEIYDVDKTGKISKEEMMKVLSSMNLSLSVADAERRSYSDADVAAFVNKVYDECDKEHDGKLSFSQFLSAVQKYPTLVEFA